MSLITTRRCLMPTLGLALVLLPGCFVVIGRDHWEWEPGKHETDHVMFMGWNNGDPGYPEELQRRADELEERLKRIEWQLELMQRHARGPAPEPAHPDSP